ncbi:translation initiation factor IF-3 [candidate division WOR-3 bacterium]|uniref:Translation initiation factor IF-3 n=1 Tax=candidate division WOR-3 bacterium TaxID=2052148 RepID=A0A660SL98_UNCW3|nr:MAG: translation initiation factor IF-3 [candidate division WOR-3 bacterium]
MKSRRKRSKVEAVKYRANYQIEAPVVKVVDENKRMIGEMPTKEAIRLAKSKGLDLIEVAPTATPPVCRILDYGKFIYEKKRKERESRKRQHQVDVRQMRFTLKISDHDYQVKLKKIRKFLTAGNRVRIMVRLRGREITRKNLALDLINQILKDVTDLGSLEGNYKIEERNVTGLIIPRR